MIFESQIRCEVFFIVKETKLWVLASQDNKVRAEKAHGKSFEVNHIATPG